ncbi:hypothetical protein SMICM304S_03143 [Streptomyces microflavus]
MRPKNRNPLIARAASVAMTMPPTTAVTATIRLDGMAVPKFGISVARTKLSKVIDVGHRVWL